MRIKKFEILIMPSRDRIKKEEAKERMRQSREPPTDFEALEKAIVRIIYINQKQIKEEKLRILLPKIHHNYSDEELKACVIKMLDDGRLKRLTDPNNIEPLLALVCSENTYNILTYIF